jgi:hypothetical protein
MKDDEMRSRVALLGARRKAHTILVGKPERKETTGRITASIGE